MKQKNSRTCALTERKSQPGNFPYSEALRILSFFAAQSSPAKASLALEAAPLTCWQLVELLGKKLITSPLGK